MDVTDAAILNETDITGLTCDSRRVEPGFLFAALPGTRDDGRRFIGQAIERGAVCVLAPLGTTLAGDARLPVFTDANPRRQYALMAANFFEDQPETVAAVTGTNGKTSVVSFLRQIWTAVGHKAASAGTLGVEAEGFENRAGLTTPDSVDLHRDLRDLKRFGVTHLALEASSHGLAQHRLDGVRVHLAAFTNLSRDHLDYHAGMDDYLAAKVRLFAELLDADGTAVVNADSPAARAVIDACRARAITVVTYGADADVALVSSEPTGDGNRVALRVMGRAYKATLPLVGRFQVSNALCALALAIASGADADACIGALEGLRGAAGRVQFAGRHPAGAGIYVDYAHTPDALENVLSALRPHAAGRLLVVFGCGGDRDAGKRPEMGAIAARLADRVIVTDDNPRSEDPARIRKEIIAAAPGADEIGDRALAIEAAVNELQAGDILVVAGKGHERGQIVGAETRPFDDTQAVRAALAKVTP